MVGLQRKGEVLHKAGDGVRDRDHELHGEDAAHVGSEGGLFGLGEGLDARLDVGQAVAVVLDLLALKGFNHIVLLWVIHLIKEKTNKKNQLQSPIRNGPQNKQNNNKDAHLNTARGPFG